MADDMTPTFARAIAQHAWDWDLAEFARRLNLDPQTEHTRGKFMRFQEMARLLGEFDGLSLAILAAH